MRILFILVFIVLIVLATLFIQGKETNAPSGAQDDTTTTNLPTLRKISFTTPDNVIIVGNFYPLKQFDEAILLLHMMPATKESWDSLAKKLQENGIVSLAIDLRGHGESTRIKNLDYRNFSDEEHQKSELDVEAALVWLQKETNLDLSSIYIAGASIGANLTLQALVRHQEIGKGIALSPGLNYRGIKTKSLVRRLRKDQEVFYVTSKDDGDNASQTQKLYDVTTGAKQWKVYDNAGHGTTMLERSSDLIPSIIEFLTK